MHENIPLRSEGKLRRKDEVFKSHALTEEVWLGCNMLSQNKLRATESKILACSFRIKIL